MVKKKKKKGLKPKELQFCYAYISHHRNGTRAYMEVYPNSTEQGAATKACAWVKKGYIYRKIAELTDEIMRREQMSAEEVLARMTWIAKTEFVEAYDSEGRLLPVARMPRHVQAALKGIEIKNRVRVPIFWDKDKQLLNLAKFHKLLTEKHEIVIKDSLADRMKAARKRVGGK